MVKGREGDVLLDKYEERQLFEALTRWNYFPNQKEGVGEIPSCFSTCQFTPEVAKRLADLEQGKNRKTYGYDHVEYFVTRYNNVSRLLALLHPMPYARLACEVVKNWEYIKHVENNHHSLIKPEIHQDGRILVMNYESVEVKASRALNDGFGKRYRAHSDISNCFHSIYTHAIPWALVGFVKAKRDRGAKLWFNKLDACQRSVKRNETQGIPIGPAVSSIMAEVILGKIDAKLVEKGFEFRRYIDDYTCYCSTYDKAQAFIHCLNQELSLYKLNINIHKTRIDELPKTMSDDWVVELSALLPKGDINEAGVSQIGAVESRSFIDAALKLKGQTPDGSVLKYAVGIIIHKIKDEAVQPFLVYLLNLSWHYPLLLPYLEQLLDHETIEPTNYESQLNSIIAENAKHNRSDGMVWPLYYIKKHDLSVSVEAYAETLKSKDCMGLLSLYATGQLTAHIVDFAYNLMCATDYEKDQYWLLLYQLYFDGKVPNPYDDKCFEVLKKEKVNFMPSKEEADDIQMKCETIKAQLLFSEVFEDVSQPVLTDNVEPPEGSET